MDSRRDRIGLAWAEQFSNFYRFLTLLVNHLSHRLLLPLVNDSRDCLPTLEMLLLYDPVPALEVWSK